MSSGKEKQLILNYINNMFTSIKWKVKYNHMTEIYGIPERVYEIFFGNTLITLATVDDVNEKNPSTHLKKDIILYKLDKNNLVKTICRLKRKKHIKNR